MQSNKRVPLAITLQSQMTEFVTVTTAMSNSKGVLKEVPSGLTIINMSCAGGEKCKLHDQN
jgi:hypothetical protein